MGSSITRMALQMIVPVELIQRTFLIIITVFLLSYNTKSRITTLQHKIPHHNPVSQSSNTILLHNPATFCTILQQSCNKSYNIFKIHNPATFSTILQRKNPAVSGAEALEESWLPSD
jgi:hypothetical protein